jgi:phage gp16-like protein
MTTNKNPGIKNFKQNQLAKIHIAKKEPNLDESTYRAMIKEHSQNGEESSADLTMLGRARVIRDMMRLGWEDKHP